MRRDWRARYSSVVLQKHRQGRCVRRCDKIEDVRIVIGRSIIDASGVQRELGECAGGTPSYMGEFSRYGLQLGHSVSMYALLKK